jgi:hypothetical protein
VHTCRCIFLIVLIWFISGGKLFQELFENVFEVLEKKKEKRNNFFLSSGSSWSGRSQRALFSLGHGLRSGLAQLLSIAGRRASLSFPQADTPGPRHSGIFHLPLVTEPVTRPSPTLPRLPSPLPWPARLAALK